MEKIYAKARAKINLNLEVLSKREDNYHNIKSVFQKINLYDEIWVEKNDDDEFKLETNIEEINNETNLIYKAYVKLKEKFNISGVRVILKKNIPMQAGLAGGSTDCACFILCINKLFNLNLSNDELDKFGQSLGADVVPCMYNKALIAEGIGEKVTLIDTTFKYYILVVKPQISCNTKEMYNKIDEKTREIQLDSLEKIVYALENNDINKIANNLYNIFEDVIAEKEIINNIKNELIENGAIGSLMTGSGSCVFGIFKNKLSALDAYKRLKDKYQIYICTSYNSKRGTKY